MTIAEEDAMTTLQEIRKLADDCVNLEAEYLMRKEDCTYAKKAWETAQKDLQDLCRSYRTSEEVAIRPLIATVEQAAEANGQPAPVDPVPDVDAWKSLPVGVLQQYGLDGSIVDKLIECNVGTLVELDDIKSRGIITPLWSQIDQDGLRDAWSRFLLAWATGERPMVSEPTADPEDEPPHHGKPVPSTVSLTSEDFAGIAKMTKRKRNKAKA